MIVYHKDMTKNLNQANLNLHRMGHLLFFANILTGVSEIVLLIWNKEGHTSPHLAIFSCLCHVEYI